VHNIFIALNYVSEIMFVRWNRACFEHVQAVLYDIRDLTRVKNILSRYEETKTVMLKQKIPVKRVLDTDILKIKKLNKMH